MGRLLVSRRVPEPRSVIHSLISLCRKRRKRDAALEWGIPIIDPAFYASEERCPDSLLEAIFRPAEGCAEEIPLLKERIRVMRECGRVFVDVSTLSYMPSVPASLRNPLGSKGHRLPRASDEPQGEEWPTQGH